MTEDVTLEFIAKRLERIQSGQAEMRSVISDMSAGQTVLTEMVLKLVRDMVQVKDRWAGWITGFPKSKGVDSSRFLGGVR